MRVYEIVTSAGNMFQIACGCGYQSWPWFDVDHVWSLVSVHAVYAHGVERGSQLAIPLVRYGGGSIYAAA